MTAVPSPVPFSSLTAPKRGNVHKLLKYHNKIGHRKEIAHYLEAVFEDGDPTLVAAALGDVARAKGMSQIARGVFSAGGTCTRPDIEQSASNKPGFMSSRPDN